jgi:anthranilate synthase component 1
MALTPDFDSFARAYEAGENQVVYTRLAADLDTPVSLMLKLTGAQKDAFMLESVTGGEVRGRYSIIGMKPDLVWRCHGEQSALNRDARFDPDAFEPQQGNPLDNLRALIAESRINLPDDLPQAAAGLFGYLGYDTVRLVEHLPDVNPDPLGLPDALMLRPSVVAVLDGVKGEVTVVSPAWASDGQSAKAAYAQAAERVMDAVRDLERALPGESRDLGDAHEVAPPVSNFTKSGYMEAVEKAKEIHPRRRYFPGGSGATPEEDKALEQDLLADKKELAEHLMLLDLGRNDTGRVSKIGTVRPTEKFIIERYSHVMHIVSNVVGELDEDKDALDAFFAGMPAGTVSGAPKVRAMEIIDELEPEKRGVYGGGVGYFSAGGDMDMCIALRTAVVKDQTLYIQAGGGVVYDSDPEAEYMETVHKSNAIRRAAADAARFTGNGNG